MPEEFIELIHKNTGITIEQATQEYKTWNDNRDNTKRVKKLDGTCSEIIMNKYLNRHISFDIFNAQSREELDRIINIIYYVIRKSDLEYKKFKNKNKILRIKYENVLKNPHANLKKIEKFLSYKSKIFFNRYSKKVNVSKKISENDIHKKLIYLKKNSSKDSHKKIHELISLYSKHNF